MTASSHGYFDHTIFEEQRERIEMEIRRTGLATSLLDVVAMAFLTMELAVL